MNDTFEQAIVARVQRGDVRVPAWPPSAGKLQRVLGKPGFTVPEVVSVLRSDDVLAATTLRLANSAWYARGEPTTTLPNAVVRIGSQQLHRLSVAAGTHRVFSAPGPLAGLRRRAWRQSLMSAAICETLAVGSGLSPDEAFVGGLLHDIGRVLAITVIEELGAADEETAWPVVERFHVELGMVIAARWMLPGPLEELIADHHARDATSQEPMLRFVQAADQVVELLEVESSVTAARLGAIGLLSTQECQLLAARIPAMPELVEAYGINQGPEASAPVVPLSGPPASVPVRLRAAAPEPISGELVHGNSTSLTVRAGTPGRPNWLVQVMLEGLSFWATVCESHPAPAGGFEWHLKPFALAADVAAKWGEVTAALA